jgi:hypothetical protein
MTRRLLLLVPLVPLLAAAPAGAGLRARTQELTYTTGANVDGVISGDTTIQGKRYGSVDFGVRRGERWLDLRLTDASGLPVLAEVSQDTNGDGDADLSTTVCGATTKPVALKARVVTVTVLYGTCGTGVSAPTTGTAVATIR